MDFDTLAMLVHPSYNRYLAERARFARMHIVSWDAPRLVAALQARYAEPLGIRVTALQSLQGVVEAALAQRADVVILPAGLVAAHTARATARRLRAQLPAAHVLLALPPKPSAVEEDLTVYDGLVSLEEPERDLAVALARLLERPARVAPRTAVTIPAELHLAAGRTLDAVTVDVSDQGAGFALRAGVEEAGKCVARFYREDGRQVDLASEVAWGLSRLGTGHRLGIRFDRAQVPAVRRLRDLAFWHTRTEADGDVIHLCGALTEATSFASLTDAVATTPRLDLAAVTGATSPGIMSWYRFLCELPAGVELRLRRIAALVAQWFEVLPGMTHRCVVESCFVAYSCSQCAHERQELIWAGSVPQPGICPECGGELWPTRPDLGADRPLPS